MQTSLPLVDIPRVCGSWQTEHQVLFGDARKLDLPDDSVHLVVTSPPYPMIAMWDAAFAAMDPEIAASPTGADFERMHGCLDAVWKECLRVLVPGGIAAINIGDATRTVTGDFQLWPNHARVLTGARAVGFQVLPDVLWRKPNNSPTKFMGSGMLPGGAYVTYEHEYVLLLRKGSGRHFPRGEARARRRASAFFWEERNRWFSDLWSDVRGTGQDLGNPGERTRSAAFPLELPWRLILMFSVAGERVVDPFLGTGTTMVAAMAAGRASTGIELDRTLAPAIRASVMRAPTVGQHRVADRLAAHRAFVAERTEAGKPPRHKNGPYGFGVVTGQEAELAIPVLDAVEPTDTGFVARGS